MPNASKLSKLQKAILQRLFAYVAQRRAEGLARYTSDGNLDPSFGSAGKVTTDFGDNSEIYSIALQPDGRIVAAGSFLFSKKHAALALARYRSDGSLDAPVNVLRRGSG